jgi:hypothetical protein
MARSRRGPSSRRDVGGGGPREDGLLGDGLSFIEIGGGGARWSVRRRRRTLVGEEAEADVRHSKPK